MVSLFRGFLVGVLGVAGIGATAYGVNVRPYSDFLKWKNRKIDTKEPVILCDDGYNRYEGLLSTVEEGTKNDRGNGVSFEFKVTSISSNETYEREWGEKATRENRGWEAWKIDFSGEKAETLLTVEVGTTNRFTSDHGQHGCGNSKIVLKNSTRVGQDGNGIEDKDIGFEIKKENCTYGFGSVTCEILFKPDSNLKWSDGFKPTITFY